MQISTALSENPNLPSVSSFQRMMDDAYTLLEPSPLLRDSLPKEEARTISATTVEKSGTRFFWIDSRFSWNEVLFFF